MLPKYLAKAMLELSVTQLLFQTIENGIQSRQLGSAFTIEGRIGKYEDIITTITNVYQTTVVCKLLF